MAKRFAKEIRLEDATIYLELFSEDNIQMTMSQASEIACAQLTVEEIAEIWTAFGDLLSEIGGCDHATSPLTAIKGA